MENPTSQLVEEAVQAIKKGEISLETGGARFGAAWPEIRGEVALILDLEKAGQSFKATLAPLDVSKIWLKIMPELTPVEVLPAGDVIPNTNHTVSPGISPLPVSLNGHNNGHKTGPLSITRTPEKEPEPINLPRRKATWGKWRKPLAWVAGIALIVVLSLSSVVGVANAAEPGDFFYGTKIWLDSARQYVAFSPEDKENFALSYCDHRTQELEWLVKNNKLQYVGTVADDYRQTLQKAFPNENSTSKLSRSQANQLKAQQIRLTQLSGQLSAVNATGSSQASAEVNKLVQQIDTYQKPGQNGPVPTTAPGPSPTPLQTPTASLGASPVLTGTTTPAPSLTPTITVTEPTASPDASIITSAVTVEVQPVSTTTPTSNPGSDSGSVVSYNLTPTPADTPVVTTNGNNGQDNNHGGGVDGNNTSNAHDTDDIPTNPKSNGNENGSNSSNSGNTNSGQHGNPPTPKPTATPAPPTATPTVVPTPTPTPVPTATPTPVQTTGGAGSGSNGSDNSGNGSGNSNDNGSNNSGNGNGSGNNQTTREPKAQVPTNTPMPAKPRKP